VSVVRRSPH